MSNSYPKKYWWIVLVIVPVAVAAIALVPRLLGGSGDGGSPTVIQDSNIIGKMEVVGTQVILNQIASSGAVEADPEELEERVQRAVNLAEAGLYEEAIALFEEVAALAPVPAVYSNLGALHTLLGQSSEAQADLAEAEALDPSFEPLQENLAQLESVEPSALTNLGEARAQESEPNNTIFQPNVAELDQTIVGTVGAEDSDFLRFTAPPAPRDLFEVRLKNLSLNLKPWIELFAASKKHLSRTPTGGVTGGQDVVHAFTIGPGELFYVAVRGLDQTQGDYEVKVQPLGAYDRYEPNDDTQSPAAVLFGDEIRANIMDNADGDFYSFESPGGRITATVENRSTTLQPWIAFYTSSRSQITHSAWGGITSGQDVSHAFDTSAGEIYIVSVDDINYTAGDYVLRLIVETAE